MSVVGFDFGNETCVIAVARRRGIEVLQNEVGNRRTSTMVAFNNAQRLIGDEAVSQYSSNYKNTITEFKRFVGRKMTDPDLQEELKFVPYTVVDIDGAAGFSTKYDGKTESFRVEQIMATMFVKLKQIAEAGLDGQRVTDCVISCPCFFTDLQRRSMMDAAQIAGLNVLRLMNETAAVALNYGILRPLPQNETREVCFVDMGRSSLQVAVVSFTQGKLKVLSTAWDIHLGGRDFDEMLVQHFNQYIKDKYKLDCLSEAKPTMKLRKECERVKKILSANSVVPFTVEYIMNETDVKGEIKREEFEEMARKYLVPRIQATVERAITESKVPIDKIDACEIIGGSTRIPCVQAALAAFFGKEVNKTCDSDESIARGCALQCAMNSPSFKVRDFDVQDVTPYGIDMSWGIKGGAIEDTNTVIGVNSFIPREMMITFKDRKDPYEIILKYNDPAKLPSGQDAHIGKFLVDGIPQPDPEMKSRKIKVRVKMNMHGICSVSGAWMNTELKEKEPEPVPEAAQAEDTPMAAAEGEEGDAMKDDESKPAEEVGEAVPEAEGDAKMTDEPKPEEPSAAPIKEEPKKEPAKPKKIVKKEELKIVPTLSGFDEKTKKSLFERESEMALADKVIHETNEARNALESYCLEMRGKICDGGLREYIEDAAREDFSSKCTDMEDWLYDEGYDAQKSEFKKRLAELKKVGDPVEKRYEEASHSDEYIKALKKEIGHWSKEADTADERFAHIEAEERQKVKDACAEADNWLATEQSKQDKVPKHTDPTLTCDALKKKIRSINDVSSKIMNKPKPKPKVEPKPEPKEEEMKDAPEGEAGEEGSAKPEEAAATEPQADDGTKPDEAAATEPQANDGSKPDEAAATEPQPEQQMDMD